MAVLLANLPIFESGTFAHSDHPDRLARMIHASATLSAGGDPFGWSPFVMGGFPDLQFYPPGFALLGAVLGMAMRLSNEDAYRLLVVVTYLLPALTVPIALRAFGVSAPVAAASGVIAGFMAFGQSGTVVGTGFGVLGSRLSLAASPLVVLAFKRASEPRSRPAALWWPFVLAVSSAAVLLFHPYHFPTAALVAFVATLASSKKGNRSIGVPILAVVAGVLIAGVWWSGLVLMSSETVPFAWGQIDLEDLYRPGYSLGPDLWAIYVGAFISFFIWMWRREGATALAIAPPLLLLVVGFVHFVMVGALGIEYFDPLRVLDSLFFWSAASSLLWLRGSGWLVGPLALLVAAGWIAIERPLLDPEPRYAPRLEVLEAGEAGDLWDHLSTGEGRVLFTSTTYGSGQHLMALTGVKSEREFLSGTSTHPSVMQAHLMYGPGRNAVRDLADVFDDVSVFDIPWTAVSRSRLSAARLHSLLATAGVTQIVTAEGAPEGPEQALSSRPDLFREETRIGRLIVFEVADPRAGPGRVAFERGQGEIDFTSMSDRAFAGWVTTRAEGVLLIRVPAAPYWRITVDGEPAEVEADELGQSLVPVSAGQHRIEASFAFPRSVGTARGLSVLGGVLLLFFTIMRSGGRVQ